MECEMYTFEDLGNSLEITIPSQQNERATCAAIAITIMTLFALAFVAAALCPSLNPKSGADLCLIPPLLLFGGTIGVIGYREGIAVLQWEHQGKEIVQVDGQGITVLRQAGRSSRKQRYLGDFIVNLRCVPIQRSFLLRYPKRESVYWSFYGPIEMTYRANIICFGSALSENEAREVVEVIKAKFPQYG